MKRKEFSFLDNYFKNNQSILKKNIIIAVKML